MPPVLTSRTIQDDPGFMLLYYCLKSMSEKPDFEQVAESMGLPTATAASKRLSRLLKAQSDAEGEVDPGPAAVPKRAGKGGRVKERSGKGAGSEVEMGSGASMEPKNKKRKLADQQDIKSEEEVKEDDKTIREEISE